MTKKFEINYFDYKKDRRAFIVGPDMDNTDYITLEAILGLIRYRAHNGDISIIELKKWFDNTFETWVGIKDVENDTDVKG